MKRVFSAGLFLLFGAGLYAQEFVPGVNAYLLPEELFQVTTDDIRGLLDSSWTMEELLTGARWRPFDEVPGEELDSVDVYFKYYQIPDLRIFYREDADPVERPLFAVESYGTAVGVYVEGRRITPSGRVEEKRLGYRFFSSADFRAGSVVVFEVEVNPYGGEEVYLTDEKLVLDDPSRFLLMVLYDNLVSFTFALITLLISFTMLVFFFLRVSRGEWFLLWFALFSFSFSFFTLFSENLINVLVSIPPITDFYVQQIAHDIMPIFLMFFYINFLGGDWRKLFFSLAGGQMLVLLLHLFIMVSGLFSEWSDILSIVFPGLMMMSITIHLLAKQRHSRMSLLFYTAFLALVISYLLQFTEEIFNIITDFPHVYGPMIFYISLGMLPVFNYFRQEKIITDQNRAFRRFVPKEFLSILSKEGILQIGLGDQVEQPMTIMFTDIRSFTSMSERMTPEENFNFLNGFLGVVGPIIRDHAGFIDKYIGDAVMALFPGRSLDAVRAARQILARLDVLNMENRTRGLPEIRIGIGIHSGDTMLGIIGEAERFEGTVISDAVNLASRLENVTKKVKVPLIFSESVARDTEAELEVKRLGTTRVKGKTERISLYTLRSLYLLKPPQSTQNA
jgi:class 3 adenylate cyclase